MGHIYYAIVDGDPLDNHPDSRVMADHDCTIFIEGPDGRNRTMVFLHDKAWCAVCNSVGTIAGYVPQIDSQRMFDMTNGNRRQSVGGDKVICQCPVHPTVMPLNGRSWMIVDEGSAPMKASYTRQWEYASGKAFQFDDRFVLCDASGQPLPYVAYAIARASGQFEYGETDGRGHTHLLASVATAEHVQIYFAG